MSEPERIDMLCAKWVELKRIEKECAEHRRGLEDEIAELIGLKEGDEGTTTRDTDAGYRIKAISRITRKVDADKLQEVAREAGLFDYLSDLFRWTPTINAKAWQQADKSITAQLLSAITSKPGRPTFSISTEKE